MNFRQDEEHQDILEMVHDFAVNEVKPLAAEIDRTEEPAGEPMTEDLLNLEGFKVNSEGVIEGYENLDLILCDGMIIFPADERCSGIGEHALDGISDAVEVYIPANITFVAPGVLEKIGGLMYIEVAPDNPVYESRDGMLYNKGGELISRPNGR